jgi:hypothetical protein
MALKTRKPTGKTSAPVILLEGGEGAGKSWAAATLSASDRVGFTAWLQLGREITADEYGLIPGVRYELIEHDGTWASIFGQICDAKQEAAAARDRGEKPFVLVIDQIGAIWDLLSDWAYNRSKTNRKNKEKLASDPNAEIDVSQNYWNDAIARWRKMIGVLLTFPGIVIILSRGRATQTVEGNRTIEGYRVEGHKSLQFDVPAWVRMAAGTDPVLMKLRTVHNPVSPEDRVHRGMSGFTLERFIFDRMKYDPSQSDAGAGMVEMVAGSEAPPSEMFQVIQLAIESAENWDMLVAARQRVRPAYDAQELTADEANALVAAFNARKGEFPQPIAQPTEQPAEAKPDQSVVVQVAMAQHAAGYNSEDMADAA